MMHGDSSDYSYPMSIEDDNSMIVDLEDGNHQQLGTRHQAMQHQQQDEHGGADNNIAVKEAKAVRGLKTVVFLVLIIATIITSLLTFFTLKREERDDFSTQFIDFSRKIIKGFYSSTSMKLWTANTISVTYTSYFASVQKPWPNVSLPDTLVRFAGARELAHASAIVFSPMLETDEKRREWEAYATEWTEKQALVPEIPPIGQGTGDVDKQGIDKFGVYYSLSQQQEATPRSTNTTSTVPTSIYTFDDEGHKIDAPYGYAPYFPVWQISPQASNKESLWFDQMTEPKRRTALENVTNVGGAVFSEVLYKEDSHHPGYYHDDLPVGAIYYPIVNNFYARERAGVISVEFKWEDYFEKFPSQFDGIVLVLKSTCGQVFTFEIQDGSVTFVGAGDLHDESFDGMVERSTYTAFHALCHYGWEFWAAVYNNGRRLDETDYSADATSSLDESILYNIDEDDDVVDDDHTCHYAIQVYPSRAFEDGYLSSTPALFAMCVSLVFIFTSVVFVIYDCLVEKRQTTTMRTAVRSSAVVDSLFPKQVQDRMFRSEKGDSGPISEEKQGDAWKLEGKGRFLPQKLQLKSFLNDSGGTLEIESDGMMSAPIADLFPNVTIMFADIAGFTAWSSEREPKDVFTLLETLYRAFDKIANKLNVFKVETIGDCYVAAAGLPERTEDHAVVMARFSYECLCAMNDLSRRLETRLGPGTADLALRVGLHSGPVTAGVLRGEKSRFQLFGDSMNTCSRMESNSIKNMIQVSASTADLLVADGKQHWLTAREDLVKAKGKGEMQTYWLRPTKKTQSSSTDSLYSSIHTSRNSSLSHVGRRNSSLSHGGRRNSSLSHGGRLGSMSFATEGMKQYRGKSKWGETKLDTESPMVKDGVSMRRTRRLVEWNVEVLAAALENVVAHNTRADDLRRKIRRTASLGKAESSASFADKNPIEEVREVIRFPRYSSKVAARRHEAPPSLAQEVREELMLFVSQIAARYHNVPFHNIEHASHVTMSANKLIKRIIVPEDVDYYNGNTNEVAANQHTSTYGISSDPLALFAILFAAVIHDVDHTGLPNSQLIKEAYPMASTYNHKSVAEQNSIDVTWNILMKPCYENLRRCIFPNEKTKKRFRQLIVNAVMATDIMDSDMVRLRTNRWEKAFSETDDDGCQDAVNRKDVNRKATIVIEHIIQASDVAHTMQHWHVYCKWNERLFFEQYKAYLAGHGQRNPAVGWYEGELWFFDNYIIPLANKLHECGVFGVSSDEYLGFALENRLEWELKGRQVCDEMITRAQQLYGVPPIANISAAPTG